ncbi:MAG: energy transducer TonB, partial [Rhodothermales bacterium]|nr:energy transducer TonB [Rhodothermales bacterium]
MTVQKTDRADLRKRYPLFFEAGLVLSLALVIFVFTIPLQSESDYAIAVAEQEVVMVEEIEQTRHETAPPPPPRPVAPVEVADDVLIDSEPLDLDVVMDFGEAAPLPPPPPPPPAAAEPEPEPEPTEPEIFVVVEQMPVLIGGLEALQARLKYPELARQASIEGTVYLQFVVDENGNVVDPVCLRDPGGGTCDAALAAVRDAKFEPGRQRGKAVK